MAKLTAWFPKRVKPVHIGIYEVRLPCNCCSVERKWDGERWRFIGGGMPQAQNLQWRGLASKPKGQP